MGTLASRGRSCCAISLLALAACSGQARTSTAAVGSGASGSAAGNAGSSANQAGHAGHAGIDGHVTHSELDAAVSGSNNSLPPGAGKTGSDASPADAGMHNPDAASAAHTKPALFWLDITAGAVYRANTDGSDAHAIVTGHGISAPDGVNVDVEDGHVYWSNMGNALGGGNLGTVQRAALDGSAVETLVPAGVGNTFKQLTIDHVHHKLYFCDREGAKVWRANFDGSAVETLASGHGFNQLVGIALDVPRAQFYFTDRNARKILRAGFDMPAGQTADNRMDIELLAQLGGNAMPIDLDLDLDKRQLYFTDRSLGTVNRMPMDLPGDQTAANRGDIVALASGLSEPIGISLDLKTSSMFFGDLSGHVWRADLDGKNRTSLAQGKSITGMTVAYLPAP